MKTTACMTAMFSLGFIPHTMAFHFMTMTSQVTSPPAKPAWNPPKLNFHKVLEQAGKTILRPGALEASAQLHSWANLSVDNRVLELASGLGRGGMDIARHYCCQQVLLTDMDKERLQSAQTRIHRLGLDHQVSTRKLDMFDIAAGLENPLQFDTVITEASLTHYPTPRKAAFLQQVALTVDPEQVLLHEVCLRDPSREEQIRQQVGQVLSVGFYPETLDTYRNLLAESGFELQQYETGPLRQMDPKYILQDEGLFRALVIAKNVLMKPDLRARLGEGRQVLSKFQDGLGFVIMRATKKK